MLYLIFVIVPGLKLALCLILIITCVGSLGSFLVLFSFKVVEGSEEVPSWASKTFKVALVTFLITGVLNMFVPSQKQMLLVLGIHSVTNIEGIEKLPKNIVKRLNDILEEERT